MNFSMFANTVSNSSKAGISGDVKMMLTIDFSTVLATFGKEYQTSPSVFRLETERTGRGELSDTLSCKKEYLYYPFP